MQIQYFKFEEDFVEQNVRCIPMIVRFKLDACGIKLKLAEWSKLSVEERINLAEYACSTTQEVMLYREYLQRLIRIRANQEPTDLPIENNPAWSRLTEIPASLQQKLNEFNLSISIAQWRSLTTLQRFATLKLSTSHHEHKNFIKAILEFNLTATPVSELRIRTGQRLVVN